MELSKRNSIISLPSKTQYFSFFPAFMKYILQSSSPKVLLKLYQCCKYFYFKSRITIAPNVWYNPEKKEIEFKFFVNGKRFFYRAYPNIEKLWLCDMLRIYSISDTILIGNEFLNNIYRNNLKELKIDSEFTLFKELEILSKSPNLIKVVLFTCVKNENGQPITVEEIMVLFPQIKTFKISPTHFTLESFEKLSKFKFLNNINSLGFWMVKTEFDPISMCKFLKETFDEVAEFSLTFDRPQLKRQLLPRVKKIINGWETKKLKHAFYC